MKRFALRNGAIMLAVAAMLAVCHHSRSEDSKSVNTPKTSKFSYPTAARGEQIDDYHGAKIADPYRWLEETDSPATKAWIEAENKLTFGYLSEIPQRTQIKERLTQLWNYERFGLPRKRGSRYFYTRNDGLQNQSVLYVAESLDAEPRVLLDPNTLSAAGTVALSDWEPNEDGSLLAYGLASAGSDWREWKVRDVATGKDLSDHLKWVKFSQASWAKDGSGFFYSRYDEPRPGEQLTGVNYFQKLFFHRIGDPQEKDVKVYDRPDHKEWGFHGGVTDDGQYLIISVTQGTERKNQVFYRELAKPASEVVELITGFDADYSFVGNDGKTFWFATDLDAPLYRVMTINTADAGRENWKTVIPETRDVLQEVNLVGDNFIALYLKDASSRVQVYDLSGKQVREVRLPSLGYAAGFGGKRGDRDTFYSFTSFIEPESIYHHNVVTGESRVFRAPKTAFRSGDFETKQEFYTSKDGTRVPIFITHRRGLKLDGNNPTILHGYGGFNIAQTPGFSVSDAVWLEMGGVYALANLRGGSEYGRAWHEAGMKGRKQNVFDDFIAAAEWLVANKYTRPEKLAARGRSNGGLLVGAAVTQRPDLFGAALPAVGVMDMLRFQKFTIGWAWVSEYGSSDDAEDFPILRTYSPLHNIKPGTRFPATLITTADHDDRVVPGHSFKFAAAMQHAHAGEAPVLIRIETQAGHGGGTPTSKLIETNSDIIAFLAKTLDVNVEGGKAAP